MGARAMVVLRGGDDALQVQSRVRYLLIIERGTSDLLELYKRSLRARADTAHRMSSPHRVYDRKVAEFIAKVAEFRALLADVDEKIELYQQKKKQSARARTDDSSASKGKALRTARARARRMSMRSEAE
jgi:hypothetical protein